MRLTAMEQPAVCSTTEATAVGAISSPLPHPPLPFTSRIVAGFCLEGDDHMRSGVVSLVIGVVLVAAFNVGQCLRTRCRPPLLFVMSPLP